MALRLEPLERKHRKLFGDFTNQHTSLTDYLKRYALRHAEKDLLSRTFLAIDAQGGTDRLAGYFSLATCSVDRAILSRSPELDRLPSFPIPGLLIARLAVDVRAQGQGLGRYLFDEALGIGLRLARAGPIGFRLLVTDAIDEAATRFYAHFGMAQLADTYPCRMVLDLAPLLERH